MGITTEWSHAGLDLDACSNYMMPNSHAAILIQDVSL